MLWTDFRVLAATAVMHWNKLICITKACVSRSSDLESCPLLCSPRSLNKNALCNSYISPKFTGTSVNNDKAQDCKEVTDKSKQAAWKMQQLTLTKLVGGFLFLFPVLFHFTIRSWSVKSREMLSVISEIVSSKANIIIIILETTY